MMSASFEEAPNNLAALIKFFRSEVTEEKRNEATTRLHLIDVLLFECLGWDRKDCTAEDRLNGSFTDYSFRCPECLLIVEAKKEGIYFELPAGMTKTMYDIQYFSKYFSPVYDAIVQALKYCQARGTPFGMVCNGHQVISFMGSRVDGRPPEQGKALVFNSLETLQKDFLLAWQCLSRQGIISRRLSLELLDVTIAPVPEKLSSKITGFPGFKSRNALQTDLQILSDLFIEDIARIAGGDEGPEFIRQCYCSSGALSQYATISKEILRKRYSAMFTKVTEGPSVEPATTKKGLNPELFARSLSKRPILLIGDVGVGKTMFIRHLCEVGAKDIFSEAVVIYIDFGSKPSLEGDIQIFIEDEIKSQLLEKYGINIEERNFVHAILHGEILQFEKGIYGDLRDSDPGTFRKHQIEYIEKKLQNKDEYMRKSLNHIVKGRKKQIVVFLDNVDQRPDGFQESAFLAGQTMADNWPLTVFISIRPETFYRSRASGTLSAYHQRAFTIAPPRVDEVITKRLKYGVDLLRRSVELGFDSHISLKAPTLADYLNILAYSFVNNKHLIEFLDNMCGGNIRLALDFVKIFVGSGHVDTEKILSIYRETGSYLVPLHEFLRAITFVDHEYYSSQASVILNMFDISMPDGKEHFLVPILLAQMDRWAQNSILDGFVHISDIYSYLQTLGYHPYQISRTLERLLYRNLLESATKEHHATTSSSERNSERTSYYRITTIGAYYVKRLIGRFSYLDAVVVDTPILSPETRDQIIDEFSIQERLERAKLFVAYLDSQWELFPECELPFQWPAVRKRIDKDIQYITGKITIREDLIEGE
jgi:hypothetical protein